MKIVRWEKFESRNGYCFGKQMSQIQVPKNRKGKFIPRMITKNSNRVLEYDSTARYCYSKFANRAYIGQIIYVISCENGILKIRKTHINEIHYFNFDSPLTLFEVWLDDYHHNSGLCEYEHYFKSYGEAKWALTKMNYWINKIEFQKFLWEE